MLRHTRTLALTLMTVATIGLGCVGGSKSNPVNKEALKQYILPAVPADVGTRLDVDFEGKVKLLGYKITPAGNAGPGTEIKLTMYWQCVETVGDGWLLFTHVLDSGGERVLNIDNVGPLRDWVDNKQALAPMAWEKGKVYVDEQTFRLPDQLNTPELTVTTGIWKGDARLKTTAGPHDRENRAIVAHIKTGAANTPKPTVTQIPLKSLRVDRMAKDAKPIKIDGKLDDDAWKTAATTGPFVDVGKGTPNPAFPVQGSAKLTWDDKNLYVGFEIQSKSIVGGFPKDAKDPHLWEKDTVEIMIDPDGDGDNLDYYEIQINPQNLVFDTRYDKYNEPKDDAKNVYGHMDWSAKLKSAVVVDGEIDKADAGKGYVVEAAIPWASFDKAKQVPPKPGDTWRMNFYGMKNNGGMAWSPIMGEGNFHKATRFGKIVFGMPGEALPTGSASGSASALPAPSMSAPMKIAPRLPMPPAK
ncbi:MAG: carbohydrate-binding family 9-like protein [Deltaproteobacteria bacterium]|nr:carbohydrate-binding family 9-like protein [Deltaproteobacteria bacterium]